MVLQGLFLAVCVPDCLRSARVFRRVEPRLGGFRSVGSFPDPRALAVASGQGQIGNGLFRMCPRSDWGPGTPAAGGQRSKTRTAGVQQQQVGVLPGI